LREPQAQALGPDAVAGPREFAAELELHQAMVADDWSDHRETVADLYVDLREDLDAACPASVRSSAPLAPERTHAAMVLSDEVVGLGRADRDVGHAVAGDVADAGHPVAEPGALRPASLPSGVGRGRRIHPEPAPASLRAKERDSIDAAPGLFTIICRSNHDRHNSSLRSTTT